jgi:beta-glucosidase
MTLAEKIGEVDLYVGKNYQNQNDAIPSLCIPALTLQDGPDGVADGHRGVTQLPASIGVAATFNPSVAYDYGRVVGAEAHGQGVDVEQAPTLNIARLPNSGRVFEGYGEDPFLVATLGVADIKGIQSEGTAAETKHLGAYTQETERLNLNQTVSQRTLEEVYLPPFKAAVEQGRTAALMCAVGKINDVETCDDQQLFGTVVQDWGFTGPIRSDAFTGEDPVAAFNAGLDMIKPAAPAQLLVAVQNGKISVQRLDDAVVSILTLMFKYELIDHPPTGISGTQVVTASDTATALTTAERSIVLLKNKGNILPLNKSALRSVAIIGQDGGTNAMTAGYGSAWVCPPFVVTPYAAIAKWLGKSVRVSYSPGGLAVTHAITTYVISSTHVANVQPSTSFGPATYANDTSSEPLSGRGWETWSTTFTPSQTGVYDFSLTSKGNTWVYVDGQPLISRPGADPVTQWLQATTLLGGHTHSVQVRWFAPSEVNTPHLAWTDVTSMITQAVTAARHAQIAIVFANDYEEEGVDRPTLSLPSDENELIEAVAVANPRTIVVLNTGGAVLMPWLSRVAAVLEAWYPGEEDGTAITSILSGAFDPAGHLPITFPGSDTLSPMGSPSSWPGIVMDVDLGGLDVGYRWYDVNGITPLFPFGFGLSYTKFSLSDPIAKRDGSGYRIMFTVRNRGPRKGTAVVQAYLSYPAAAQEPPYELKAFTSVTLDPGRSRAVSLDLPASAFQIYSGNGFSIAGGTYTVSLGQNERNLPVRVNIAIP